MLMPIAAAVALTVQPAALENTGQEPVRALLITGHNNHNWPYTSRVHEETLEATGRFVVDITEDPQTTLADRAGLAAYRVFILDYNDFHEARRWGEAAERNFVEAVEGGVGVVAIHSANNAFKGWTEYERMLGLMWREGTGHGEFHRFDVEIVDKDHPITRGMAGMKDHPDELYHRLANPQGARPRMLMRAMSAEKGGSGQVEPMAFTLEYGKGRVFATPLGHVWANQASTKASVLDPQFRALVARGAEWAATGEVTLPATWSDTRMHNRLTPEEQAAGWTLLFDGSEMSAENNFRGFRQDEFPVKGWVVRDGAIVIEAGGGAGDLITRGQYADFEFACEWKVGPKGNSGIIYRCTEDHGNTWETGPEMQILDDAGHRDGAAPDTRAGALYDLFPCTADVVRPAGEWNSARIVARGTRVEHWLNGVKVVDVDMASEAYKSAHAQSKWPGMPDFGKREKGHIALQDHGDEVWFRNLRVRVLE